VQYKKVSSSGSRAKTILDSLLTLGSGQVDSLTGSSRNTYVMHL